ncbi:MAG: hypothetical protein HZY76_08680 [Anaerolineae bacterium]|nr:MAG: hypothetical protein HZY76_08680 [Anaerolineae bacterium]
MTVWELGSQGSRALETLLSAAAEQDTRLGRWYNRVRQTHWGQADLLQVMEEIESLGVGVQAAWMQLRLTRARPLPASSSGNRRCGPTRPRPRWPR